MTKKKNLTEEEASQKIINKNLPPKTPVVPTVGQLADAQGAMQKGIITKAQREGFAEGKPIQTTQTTQTAQDTVIPLDQTGPENVIDREGQPEADTGPAKTIEGQNVADLAESQTIEGQNAADLAESQKVENIALQQELQRQEEEAEKIKAEKKTEAANLKAKRDRDAALKNLQTSEDRARQDLSEDKGRNLQNISLRFDSVIKQQTKNVADTENNLNLLLGTMGASRSKKGLSSVSEKIQQQKNVLNNILSQQMLAKARIGNDYMTDLKRMEEDFDAKTQQIDRLFKDTATIDYGRIILKIQGAMQDGSLESARKQLEVQNEIINDINATQLKLQSFDKQYDKLIKDKENELEIAQNRAEKSIKWEQQPDGSYINGNGDVFLRQDGSLFVDEGDATLKEIDGQLYAVQTSFKDGKRSITAEPLLLESAPKLSDNDRQTVINAISSSNDPAKTLNILDKNNELSTTEKASILAEVQRRGLGSLGAGLGSLDTASRFQGFTDEQIALNQIPPTLRNSEIELNRFIEGIQAGLAEGKTPFEIADTLIGFSIENKENKPFADRLKEHLFVADAGSIQNNDFAQLARLINAGNRTGAIIKIENILLQNVDDKLKENRFANQIISKINKAIKIANELDPGKLGVFDASLNKVTIKSPLFASSVEKQKSQRLASILTEIFSQFRKERGGTALTDTEARFLDPVIATLNDQPETLNTKLDEFKNLVLQGHNSTREQVGLPRVDENQILDVKDRIRLYEPSISERLFQKEMQTTFRNQPIRTDIRGRRTSRTTAAEGANVPFTGSGEQLGRLGLTDEEIEQLNNEF